MLTKDGFKSSLLAALSWLQPETLASIHADLGLLADEAAAESILLPESAEIMRSAVHALLALRGSGSPVKLATDKASALAVWGFDSVSGEDFVSKAVSFGSFIAGDGGFRLFEPYPSSCEGRHFPSDSGSLFARAVGKRFGVLLFPAGVNWPDFADDGSKPLADMALWAGVTDWQVLA